MKRLSVAFAASVLLANGFAAPTLQAGEYTYSVVGAACVPTGQTVAANNWFNSAGDVKFNTYGTGEIILTCSIPSSLIRASQLEVFYRDTDGQGTYAQVRATLREKDLASGSVVDVGYAKVDSNQWAATSTYHRMAANIGTSGCGEFTFDHAYKTYYVQINLQRTFNNYEAIVSGIRLSIPAC